MLAYLWLLNNVKKSVGVVHSLVDRGEEVIADESTGLALPQF